MQHNKSGHVPPTTGACAVGSSADPERDRRGAPPKRGATASAIINVRVDADRKNHYTRFAKKRRTGDKTLAGLVIETLDAATGYREGTNDQGDSQSPAKKL